MSTNTAPVPIDTTTEAFAKFAENEPSSAMHIVARVTLDTNDQESLLIDAAYITYDPATKKANITGLLPQSRPTKKVTYKFKSDDRLYAVYRVKNIKIPNQVKAFIADPSILTAKDVDLAFGADIISDFVKYTKLSKAVEQYSGRPCAVIHIGKSLDTTHDKADFDDIKIYFGELSVRVCDLSAVVFVKNSNHVVAIPCADVTSIYVVGGCDTNIPILPMDERVEQFNKCGSTNVYGAYITQTMRNAEAQYIADQISKAKQFQSTTPFLGDFFKAFPDVVKDKQSWTLALKDGQLTFTT